MRVKFNFSSHDSPEVLRLAASFLTTLSELAPEKAQVSMSTTEGEQEETPAKKKRAVKPVEESPPAQIAGGSDTPAVDLPKVRALLSEKSRTGKLTQVQALIAQYGGKTLPDIPADKLAEVYSKGLAL